MTKETFAALQMLMLADQTVATAHRTAILRLCREPNPAANSPGKMLSAREVAKRAGCCVRTIFRAAARGDLTPVRRSCRSIRFREDEVLQWLTGVSELDLDGFLEHRRVRAIGKGSL